MDGEGTGVVRIYKKFKSSGEGIGGKGGFYRRDDTVFDFTGEAEKEAGCYFLESITKKYEREPITQRLARKKGTDDYYAMKILLLDDSNTSDNSSFLRRTIFHNEYSILSLLKNCPGVIQVHDLFKDYVLIKDREDTNKKCKLKRICMVLECLFPHRHHNNELIALDDFIQEGKLREREALHVFYNLLLVIEELHKRNVVHRNLKLSNVILNRKTFNVKLVDFSYAKLLTSTPVECNQCRKSSLGLYEDIPECTLFHKTFDIWSAGIIFHAMLFGSMPFAGSVSSISLPANCNLCDMQMKVMKTDCTILKSSCISEGSKKLLRSILCKSPQLTLNAAEVLDMVFTLLAVQPSSQNPNITKESKKLDQIVPECSNSHYKYQQECGVKVDVASGSSFGDVIEQFENKSINEKPLVTKNVCDNLELLRKNSSIAVNFSEPNLLINDKKIKKAMLQLGATSINIINALSFSYCKKNSCRS